MKIATYMPRLSAFALAVCVLLGSEQESKSSNDSIAVKTKQPNILLIVADDMGYSDIGPFGGEIATPALDSLAEQGLQLTNFHVLPTCSPSRSVLLSGVDNHQAGLGTMGELTTPEMEGVPGYEGYLNFDVASLPEVLKDEGYHTYMVGKWHLGHDKNTIPSRRGFEETFVLVPGGGSHWSDRLPVSPAHSNIMDYRRNGQPIESLPNDFYSTKNYTDNVLQWMRKNSGDGKPFFAYMAYTAPHDPLHAPKEYIEKYNEIYDQGWDHLREKRFESLKNLGIYPKDTKPFPRLSSVKPWDELSDQDKREAARDMEVYAAMIDYLDEQVNRIFNYLKEAGEYDNTMIIFMSDNGANGHAPTTYPEQTEVFLNSFDNSLENRGLPGSFVDPGPGWSQASMAPSRMYKVFTSEGGIKAPLLVKLPGKMSNAGTMNHSFFHIRDLMPTILDVAQVDPKLEINGRKVMPMQGQSVLAMINGSADTPYAGADEVGYELFGLKAYFDGDWKVLWMPEPVGKGDWELFNLKSDPAELNDLSKQHPEKLQELTAKWHEYKEENGVLDVPRN
jgi:arylsulfatase A-like enzyme